MAADLHIHVITKDATEEHYKVLQSNTLGSNVSQDDAFKAIMDSPAIWIGEVSWLKAALVEDGDEFIPNTVQAVREIIGEDFPVLDDDLKMKILAAFDLENTTSYSLADPEDVEKFLDRFMGQKLFTISW